MREGPHLGTGVVVESRHKRTINPVPKLAVHACNHSDGGQGLSSADALNLISNGHVAEILKHQHKLLSGLVQIAIEQVGRSDRNVWGQPAVKGVFALVKPELTIDAKASRIRACQLDDDAPGAERWAFVVGQLAAQDCAHQPCVLADWLSRQLSDRRDVAIAPSGQRTLHPCKIYARGVFGE